MIVAQLISQLGFQYNPASANAFNASMQQMQSSVQGLQSNIQQMSATSQSALKGLAAGVGFSVANIAFSLARAVGHGLVNLTTGFVEAGDEYGAAMMRLGQSTNGPQQAVEVYDALYKSARQTGIAIMDSSKVFMQFNPAVEKAGLAVSDTTNLIDGLNKAMIMSGSSTARTTAVLTQIGQALNSGNFAGDELKSFLENAPTKIIDAFATAIGKTREELKKLGSTGKLTNSVVLPGLLAAAKAAQAAFPDEMASVSLAWKGLGVSVTDFAGKLNKLLGVNRNLSRAINAVADAFEWMAKGVTAIQKLVDSIGGLRRIFWSIVSLIATYFMPAFLLAVGPAAVAIVANLGVIFSTLGMIISGLIVRMFLLALPFAMLAGWFLVIEDFIMWMRGGDSLFGRKFGDFDKVFEKITAGIDQLKAYIFTFADEVTDKLLGIWRNFYAGLGPASQRILGVFGLTGQEGSGQATTPSVGQAAVAGAGNWIEQQQSQGALGWIFDKIAQIDRYLPLPNLTGVNPTPPNAYNVPATVTQSNTNTITVTATTNDPSGIAAATQSGQTQANENSLVRLGDTFARGLLMASPRSEAAAQ